MLYPRLQNRRAQLLKFCTNGLEKNTGIDCSGTSLTPLHPMDWVVPYSKSSSYLWNKSGVEVTVGEYDDWIYASDHMPLLVTT